MFSMIQRHQMPSRGSIIHTAFQLQLFEMLKKDLNRLCNGQLWSCLNRRTKNEYNLVNFYV
jgi:hypothetical protein